MASFERRPSYAGQRRSHDVSFSVAHFQSMTLRTLKRIADTLDVSVSQLVKGL
jgi:hypothetical protein